MSRKNIAGMSIGGGRKENFFFCLLEYFEDSDRWFLASVHQVKDEDDMDGDEAIANWVEKYELTKLIVDFPLSRPTCDTCELECPGTKKCDHPTVTQVRERMTKFLAEDAARLKANPKKYEEQRVEDNMVHYSRDTFNKHPTHHMLSKSFKRRLKKGYIPYWNRPIDYFIWEHYYDQLLGLFKVSYDSFSNVSTMLLSKFKYLLRHLPNNLDMHESNPKICLLELLRRRVIKKNHLQKLSDLEESVIGRLEIIQLIEKELNVFIYDNDLEVIVKNPKAFDSFLLSVVGKQYLSDKIVEIPDWAQKGNAKFVLPAF
jgi:hypothetical protein